MDIFGPKWVRCSPTDSILFPTSLKLVHTMAITTLTTSATYFGLSHTPNNIMRSSLGLPAIAIKTDHNRQTWPLVVQDRHTYQECHKSQRAHSRVRTSFLCFLFANCYFRHGPKTTAYLAILVCGLVLYLSLMQAQKRARDKYTDNFVTFECPFHIHSTILGWLSTYIMIKWPPVAKVVCERSFDNLERHS